MKPWIKRTGLGLFGVIAVCGGLSAWAHAHHPGRGWQALANLSDADSQAREERFVARAADKLKLDDAQKARLATLALALREQRKALITQGSDPRAELQSLIAGAQFDRAKAGAMVDSKVQAVAQKSPAVLDAAAAFYDSLKPEQQAQLRDFMAQRRHGGWHRG